MLQNEPVFRKLGPDDLDEVLHVERLSFSRPWSREAYGHELADNPLASLYGFFDGDRLFAFICFWMIVDEIHIGNIAVHPAYRRQGFGELLLRRVMAICQGQGGKRMTLEVRKRNFPARDLYLKLGFTIEGERRDYYQDPKDDALIMWIDLSAANAAAGSE